jgi:3-keto-disaccharide hydrolase
MLPISPRCLAGLLTLAVATSASAQVSTRWPQHAMDRPQPRIVGPAPVDRPDAPPTDAVVLFDGSDLSQWAGDSGQAAPWKVENGYAEVVPGSGFIHTRRGFGDCQLHIEWEAPTPPHGEGQERGNSGVFLMGRYEVQVLDSYDNKTYPDGQAAAVYGQFPPLVNAARPPGEWQSYDIVFHRPRFDARGRATKPARVTVFHNGVLVQDNVELSGPTAHQERPPYTVHPDSLPLGLQDHGNAVRYRNIWIRPLDEETH